MDKYVLCYWVESQTLTQQKLEVGENLAYGKEFSRTLKSLEPGTSYEVHVYGIAHGMKGEEIKNKFATSKKGKLIYKATVI